ncbi:hypothetical protein [Streptomyces cacaoi]|uniref:Uncharacterized protein n=1 Tax=Streptomyces cacaoi TaxID=1898 RepID=A0A4Y3R4P8_STRCI|nr:hypothetical protein [Streptomyces cacaoi]GEB52661.1 hypothetical protein SCA03_52120 [Streptomyces cacaoi]
MDLTARLLRAAAARPRLLVLTTPGGTPVRLAVEREARLRDWPVAATPADAGLLVLAGPGHPGTAPAVERLWRDMPGPRARLHARHPDEVAAALDAARARLASPDLQRADAAARPAAPPPDELPMAEQGPDRDGLWLDRLHVPLGPFLPDWPAGLVLRLVLQGDVVQQAALAGPAPVPGPAAGAGGRFWAEPWLRAAAGEPVTIGEAARRRAAAQLDSLARLLALAGRPGQATRARRLRDALLAHAPEPAVRPAVAALHRAVCRWGTLRRLTRGLGVLSTAEAEAAGVSGPAARADGDVFDRCREWLECVARDVRRLDATGPLDPADPVGREGPRGRTTGPLPPSVALAGLLPRLLTGTELAGARLIVASLDPDPDELAAAGAELAHD